VAPDVAWVGSALAVGQRAIPLRRIKAATDASIFLAIHLIFPIDLVSLGNAEPQSDLAQQDKYSTIFILKKYNLILNRMG
jgi:hypothetical protein